MVAKPHDRRQSARFPLELHFRYRVLDGLRTVAKGSGTTVDISRTGLRFRNSRSLVPGTRMELVVNWPVRFGGFYPMELCILGTIVQCRHGDAVMRIGAWHFRFPAVHPGQPVVSIAAQGWTRCRTRGEGQAQQQAAT